MVKRILFWTDIAFIVSLTILFTCVLLAKYAHIECLQFLLKPIGG